MELVTDSETCANCESPDNEDSELVMSFETALSWVARKFVVGGSADLDDEAVLKVSSGTVEVVGKLKGEVPNGDGFT